MILSKINPDKIKKAIICKNVKSSLMNKQIKKTHIPRAGDVAVFKVKAIGKHTRIQHTRGSNSFILPGDLIMAAFGNRYATEQMEGYVPDGYRYTYHILGQGGAIGVLKTMHKKFELVGPTSVNLVGYVTNENGEIINTKYHNTDLDRKHTALSVVKPKIVLSLGTSMDSGKTTSAAFLARGLKLAKKMTAYIKLTGTVFTKDKNMVKDYGANIVIDFSDAGFPSTYMCSMDELLPLYSNLLDKVKSYNIEYIIVEIADGLLQRETNALIHNQEFMNSVAGVMFSSSDSMSAIAGADILLNLGYKLIGVTGLFTTSPLLVEEVRLRSKHTVLMGEDLMSATIVDVLRNKLKYLKFENKMVVNI